MRHCSHQSIKATIFHATGLEEMENKKVDCASCMVAKATLQPNPHRKDRAVLSLERVYMDLLSCGVTSLEGYDHTIVITDDATNADPVSMSLWV
jgi:hypothetical protein